MAHNRDTDGRRDEDKCLVKRLYARATPYVQVFGFFVVAIPSGMSASQLIGDARAFDSRLSAVEQAQFKYSEQQEIIKGKLDTVIYFVRRK